MVTRVKGWVALAALVLFVTGCGEGDPVAGFTGGKQSKDKAPIPSTVNANANASTASAAAAPANAADAPQEAGGAEGVAAVEGPAVAQKLGQEEARDPEAPIRENSMEYRAMRHRDPFVSLIGGDENRGELVDLAVVSLVGVVLGAEKFCVVEDGEGTSYVLYEGDRVKNGRVVDIREDAVVCSQTVLGYTTTVQLKLEEGKDGRNVG